MTLKHSFCPSPWLHMRINNAGQYEYCRWAVKHSEHQYSIHDTEPAVYFQRHMTPVRQQLSQGEQPLGCAECAHMEQHGKVSGRQKQLLKIGVGAGNFEKSLASSPWISEFVNQGPTHQLPQDWQIDLGNYCNSACVFCNPTFSSRLATEFKKIGLIKTLPPANWTDNPQLVERFINTLKQSKHIQYLHFIGGETLITPAFKTILQALIQVGLNKTATIGFTTNLMVWQDDVVNLLTKFHNVNLGMSIESFDVSNEYARWPAKLDTVSENIDKWLRLSKRHGWLVQFRTTPTVLTVANLLSVYEYAWDNNVAVESCNFLSEPAFLRPAVLPLEYREQILAEMQCWINARQANQSTIINVRNPNLVRQQLVQDLQSYVTYLQNEEDQSWRLPELASYLKKLDNNRGISILDYLPKYEKLFRAAGY